MIRWGKNVNIETIAEELREVGITGRMDADGYLRHPRSADPADHGLTVEEQQTLAQVIAAHDPTPRPNKQQQAEVVLRALRRKPRRDATDAEALQNALIDYLLP